MNYARVMLNIIQRLFLETENSLAAGLKVTQRLFEQDSWILKIDSQPKVILKWCSGDTVYRLTFGTCCGERAVAIARSRACSMAARLTVTYVGKVSRAG
jgi:hypothetical protein